jgi:hypothetical protein
MTPAQLDELVVLEAGAPSYDRDLFVAMRNALPELIAAAREHNGCRTFVPNWPEKIACDAERDALQKRVDELLSDREFRAIRDSNAAACARVAKLEAALQRVIDGPSADEPYPRDVAREALKGK